MNKIEKWDVDKMIEFEDVVLNRRMFKSLIFLSEIKGGFLTTDYLRDMEIAYNKRMKPIEDVLNALEKENNG